MLHEAPLKQGAAAEESSPKHKLSGFFTLPLLYRLNKQAAKCSSESFEVLVGRFLPHLDKAGLSALFALSRSHMSTQSEAFF